MAATDLRAAILNVFPANFSLWKCRACFCRNGAMDLAMVVMFNWLLWAFLFYLLILLFFLKLLKPITVNAIKKKEKRSEILEAHFDELTLILFFYFSLWLNINLSAYLIYLFIYLFIINFFHVDNQTTFLTFANEATFPGRITTTSNLWFK